MPFMMKFKDFLKSFVSPICNPIRFGILVLLLGSIWIGIRVSLGWLGYPVCASPSQAKIVTINIKKGATFGEIGKTLAQNKVIKSGKLFVYYGRLTGQDKKMQAGVYRVSNTWTMQEIMDCVSSGKTATIRVTIPEGYNVKQIDDLLVQKGIVNRDLFQKAVSANYSYSFLKNTQVSGLQRLEGFLFPATYELRPGMTEEEIVNLMLQSFQGAFTPELKERAEKMGFTTQEVVTLASLVEREAKLKQERPMVAAVFLNRLQVGMPLQSCATVQYVLGKQKEVLSNRDLQNPSPYNTYLHAGLPPGPIANPGIASIKAVLYPADVDYLYFVAKGDGSHHFSKTFGEHQTAARRYQGN